MNIKVTPRSARGMSGVILPPPFFALDLNTTCAWGSRPGEARVRYVPTPGVPPVPIMAHVLVQWEGHAWSGVCLDDQDEDASRGHLRSLRVSDTRQYLEWDTVFAAFNQRDNRIVDGRLERRFWHILPRDYVVGRKTFTARPYTGHQILESVFGFTRASRSVHYTVETRWRLLTPRILKTEPVLDLDWLRGATTQQIAQEVADRLGLVVGVIPEDPWTLRFERKGYGFLPRYAQTGTVFPPLSDDRRWGWSYSGTPTRVRVVGDRSVYQVLNIELEPDWVLAWTRFLDITELEADLYKRAVDAKGRRLNALPGDTDQTEGRFLAAALAREITVGQYATLRRRQPLVGDNPKEEWRDPGLWQGRRRNDMPAALYLTQLLFRAFRPRDLRFRVSGAAFVPLESMEVLPRLLVPVSHDPISGRMAVDLDSPTDGNGYAIAQGYQVGAEGLLTVQPEFFKLDTWRNLQDLWQSLPFTVDQSGERYPTILFQDPVIRSDNLVDMIDGLPVIKADAVIQIPKVRACLVFAAEIFQYIEGVGPRDRVEVVANLAPEYVVSASGDTRLREIPYADGQTARFKARRIARGLLEQPAFTIRGGYRLPGVVAQRLSGVLDRISCVVSAGGSYTDIDFTTERLPVTFESERRFDRVRREQLLMPGQAELKQEARALRILATAIKSAPDLRASMQAFLRGTSEPPVRLRNVTTPTATLPVGTPLWGGHSYPGEPGQPSATSLPFYTRFYGVTTREGEPMGGLIPAQSTGMISVRVRGPVAANDLVGKPAPVQVGEFEWITPRHLEVGGATLVGAAQSDVPAGVTRLIRVLVGPAKGGPVKALQKWSINPITRQLVEPLESFGPAFGLRMEIPPANSLLEPPLESYATYIIHVEPDSSLQGALPRVTFRFVGTGVLDRMQPITMLQHSHHAWSGAPQEREWACWGWNLWDVLEEERRFSAHRAEELARFYALWAQEGWANPGGGVSNIRDAPSLTTPTALKVPHVPADQILVEFI